MIVRIENGAERRFKFNYNEVVRGKNTHQNIRLVAGRHNPRSLSSLPR